MTEPPPDDQPPLLRTWGQVYAVVIGWLVLCVAGLWALTRAFT